MSETPAVTVTGATCHFDVSPPWLDRVLRHAPRRILRAVEDVSFSVPRGKTFSVVGESGCGKSTLARMMVGLQPPTAGKITFGSVMRPDGSVVPPRVQMIFQDPYASLNPRWRVGDIIAEPIRELKLMTDEAKIAARIAELLKTVGFRRRMRGVSRMNSRAGSASASPSPAHSPRKRIFWSATNRPRRSMSRCRRRS